MTQDTLKGWIGAVGAVAVAVCAFRDRKGLITEATGPAFFAFLVFACFSLLSIAWSHSMMGIDAAMHWSYLALALFAIRLLAADPSWVESMLKCIWLGSVLAALTGTVQFITGWSWIDQAVAPSATFANRNVAAEYLVCALPIGCYLAAKECDPSWRRVLSASAGVVVAFIVMTGSRSSMLAIACQIGLLIVVIARVRQEWRDSAMVAMPGIALCVGLLLVPSLSAVNEYSGLSGLDWALRRVLMTGQDATAATGSIAYRFAMWQATAKMFFDSPVVGIGAGAWEVEIPRYLVLPNLLEADYYAHSEWLQVLAEYGLLGGVAIGTFLWGLFRRLRSLWGQSGAGPLDAMTACGLVGLAVTATAGFPMHQYATLSMAAVLLALPSAHKTELNFGFQNLGDGRRRFNEMAILGCIGLVVGCVGVYQSLHVVAEASLIEARNASRAAVAEGKKDGEWLETVRSAALHELHGRGLFDHTNRVYLPAIATSLARAGDLEHAVVIWEGVAALRPNLLAVKCVLLKASAAAGNMGRAMEIYTDPTTRVCQQDFDAQSAKSEPENATEFAQ